MTLPVKERSNWWFVLPVFFSVVGGVASFFVMRKGNPTKAKICLVVGAAMLAVWFFGFQYLTYLSLEYACDEMTAGVGEFAKNNCMDAAFYAACTKKIESVIDDACLSIRLFGDPDPAVLARETWWTSALKSSP